MWFSVIDDPVLVQAKTLAEENAGLRVRQRGLDVLQRERDELNRQLEVTRDELLKEQKQTRLRRDEVNAVLANQRELVSAARDIKNFVTDVHSKVSNIQQSQARGQGSVQPVGGSQGAGQGDMAYVQQVSNIRQFQQGFTHNKAFF